MKKTYAEIWIINRTMKSLTEFILLIILVVELGILITRSPQPEEQREEPVIYNLPDSGEVGEEPEIDVVPADIIEEESEVEVVPVDYSLNLISSYESFSPTIYKCPAGKSTIGFGFTDKRYLAMSPMSEEKAWDILANEIIPKYREIVRSVVRVPLTPNQEAALISFTFNCGEGCLRTLVSKPGRLNDGNYESTAKAMKLYVKAKVKGKITTLNGLVKRRKSEYEMFSQQTTIATNL
jgi:lysozyme